jgi:hypothetical protein
MPGTEKIQNTGLKSSSECFYMKVMTGCCWQIHIPAELVIPAANVCHNLTQYHYVFIA